MASKQPIPGVFEYPASWEQEYKKRRRVEEWRRNWPEQFGQQRRGKRRPGTLQYFAQYALMYLLRRDHAIKSMTWLHIAAVDMKTRKNINEGKDWSPASPSPSKSIERTRSQWETMRAKMGFHAFDLLQERIVRAGFSRHTGEPDLFCYSKRDGWFFVEAKRVKEPLGEHQKRWFTAARKLPRLKVPIYIVRVVPKGS